MPTLAASLPVRDLYRTLRSTAKVRPAGGLWLTGDPAAVAAARAALGAGARAVAEAPDAAEAGLVVYAGEDLAALAEAARAARPRPLAALLPEALELAAWRVPGVSGAVTSAEELPALVASLLPPEGAALASRLPAVQGPFVTQAIGRTSLAAALAAARAPDHEATSAALAPLESRLLLRLAAAGGQKLDQARMPELIAAALAGQVLRGVAARAGSGRALRVAAAVAGTRAIGLAAALRYAAASSPASTARSTG